MTSGPDERNFSRHVCRFYIGVVGGTFHLPPPHIITWLLRVECSCKRVVCAHWSCCWMCTPRCPLGGSAATPSQTPLLLYCAYWFSTTREFLDLDVSLMKCSAVRQDKQRFCSRVHVLVFAGGTHVTTEIGLFTTRDSPFPQAQKKAQGPVELSCERLCQGFDCVLNLVWMRSEPHRKEPLTRHSFLLSPGPICCPRFVVNVVSCP